ncbi:hypothetical protein F4806DRAFT_263668 [Annulohypoxylon nitens]|nr:hypothetical protein F4806DRAFT_263668 [Annulohypoxylon nitens]
MDDSRSPIGRFKAFVDSIARKGMNGKGEAASYVPFDQIEAYWSSERIENILQLSSNIPTFTAMEISHSYLKVFSILVLIDQVDYQSEFLRRRVEDTNLPIDQKWPYKCSVSQFNDDVIPRFYETQWAFCPVVISMEMPTYEGELNPRAILPFLDKQQVRRNDVATWSIARIMNPREDSQKDGMIYVLLKEYPNSYYNLYQQESKLLAALDRRHTKAMVRYYGSYSQVDTSTILLEYSTGHSLNELFNQEPPSRLYDVVAFWTSLAHVAEALSCIHRQNISEQGGPSKWSSMLYDMKPENVIWFREFSECLYCFKLSTDGYTNANQRVLSNVLSPRINDIHGSFRPRLSFTFV